MTSPFRLPDYAPSSRTGEQEFAAFQVKQRQLLDSLLTQTALDAARQQQAQGPSGPQIGMPSQEFLGTMPGSEGPAPVVGQAPSAPGPISQEQYDHLIDAARFWDIPNPEAMAPEQLRSAVEQKQLGMQSERSAETSDLGDLGAALGGTLASAGSGLAEGLANMLGWTKKIPFVGDTLARIQHTDQEIEWLRRLGRNLDMVSYGIGQGLPLEWNNGAYGAYQKVGTFTGQAIPAFAVWEAIGAGTGISAVAKYGGRISAFDRAAMVLARGAQGYATSMVLEGQNPNLTDEQKQHTYWAGGVLGSGGEVLGQALGPILGRVIGRIRSALKIPQAAEPVPGTSLVPRTEDADWSFITNEPLPGPTRSGGPLLTAPVQGPGVGAPGEVLGLQAAGEPLGLPSGQPRGLLGAGASEGTAVARPANPSDVVEAQYIGADKEIAVRPAIRFADGTHEAITASDPFHVTSMQRFDAVGHIEELWPGAEMGYITTADRFVPHSEAQASGMNLGMTPLEMAQYHDAVQARTAFEGYGVVHEPPVQPDWGSKRFLEGKPAQGPTSSVLALTKIRHPETGLPERMYHGTGASYDMPDPSKSSDPESLLFGPGYYTTNDYTTAGDSGYTKELADEDYIMEVRHQLEMAKEDYRKYQNGEYPLPQGMTMEEALTDIQREIDNHTYQLSNPPAPQVRPQYLDIRNPFDIDAPYTEEHVAAIVDALRANGVGEGAITTFELESLSPVRVGVDSGEELYNRLYQLGHSNSTVGVTRGGPGFISPTGKSATIIGKALANKILEDAGFDGIVHIGGGRMNDHSHRVAIAFRSSQVHPAYEPTVLESLEAERLAAQYVREQIVLDSPDLPELAGKPTLSDTDVANAAVSANPGGVTIIKGVGMPAEVVAGLKSGDIRFALRPDGGLDALVGENVSQEMVEQYQNFGMFKGQRASVHGLEVTIVIPGLDVVGVEGQGFATGNVVSVSRSAVTLGRSGVPQVEAPQEWEIFKFNTLAYANEEALKAGMQPVESMTDFRVSSILQTRMKVYAEQKNLSVAEEQLMTQYFSQRWAEEFRALAPEEAELESLASIMSNPAYDEEAVAPAIEDVAESKGFVWLSQPGQGGQLQDVVGGMDLPTFATDDAARAFLDGMDRELPDLAPPSDVPLEVMNQSPPSRSGSPLEPGPGVAGPETEMANLLEGAEAADENYGDAYELPSWYGESSDVPSWYYGGAGGGGAGGGGGRIGGPPGDPNEWFGPLGPQFGPEPPGLGQRIANRIHRFMEENPNQYALWRQQVLESVLWRNRPTRYKFLAYEQYLTRIGAEGNKAWSMIDDLFTAITKAHNEATPWHRRASEILSRLPRRFMRSGDFVRVHELTDPVDQERVWQIIRQRYGWGDAKYAQVREASADVRQFYRDLFATKVSDPQSALTAEREIWNYIPRMRAYQAQGRAMPASEINPLIEDFAEYAREGGLQFRQMDIRDLMYHSVTATFNKKYMAEPFAELINTWQHPGIPDEVKEPILGIARLARYGQDMGHSAAVRGVKTIFRSLGLPISTKEAASMLNTPMGWNYKALLGGRPSVLFRDAIQPLKAGIKTGMPKILDIYRRAFSSPSFKAEMIDQGIKGGWVEVDRAQFEGAGLFEQVAGSNADIGPITENQMARREFFARIGDTVRDAIPPSVRNLGARLDPLRPYAKVSGLWNRAIAGRAGWERASEAIQEFRGSQQAYVRGEGEARSIDWLMENSSAGTYEQPIQDKFREMILNGQDEEAANFIARQTADWSQGRYGTKETMQFNRGYTGRLVMQFGNFAPQELESIISIARNGTPAQRTKSLLTYSAINAAMYGAAAVTGWSFGKWAWAQGIAFGGGPAIDPAIQAYQFAQGVAQTAGGNQASPQAVDAARRYENTNLTDVLAPFNPYQGALNTVDQLTQAIQSSNPAERTLRHLITGDRGSRIDFQRQLEAATQLQGFPKGSLSPNGGTLLTREELLRRMGQQPPQPAPRNAGSIQ